MNVSVAAIHWRQGGGEERHRTHTFSGNFPTLVPPNFCTTQPLGQLFLTADLMIASLMKQSWLCEVRWANVEKQTNAAPPETKKNAERNAFGNGDPYHSTVKSPEAIDVC